MWMRLESRWRLWAKISFFRLATCKCKRNDYDLICSMRIIEKCIGSHPADTVLVSDAKDSCKPEREVVPFEWIWSGLEAANQSARPDRAPAYMWKDWRCICQSPDLWHGKAHWCPEEWYQGHCPFHRLCMFFHCLSVHTRICTHCTHLWQTESSVLCPQIPTPKTRHFVWRTLNSPGLKSSVTWIILQDLSRREGPPVL